MPSRRHLAIGRARATAVALILAAAAASWAAAPQSRPCPQCDEWNAPQQPLRIFGNVYYVGTHGLSAILITSPTGHVLIDGDLAQSVPAIVDHIRQAGFRIDDVKLIVNSHVHFDHAGGIADLQRRSVAVVAASPRSAPVLASGRSGRDDPQFGIIDPIAPVKRVRTIRDGETLYGGTVAVTAHFTPGHTPGGTSWTWRSCEEGRCLEFVYADSVTAVSADDFQFTHSRAFPDAVAGFGKSLAWLDAVACDVLITPHPEASGWWPRVERRDSGDGDALVDRAACARYAAGARQRLNERIARERAAGPAGSR